MSLPWIVRGSDRAVEHARSYEQKIRRAFPFGVGGAVLTTASLLAITAGYEGAAAGMLAGSTLQFFGLYYGARAQRELNEAISWYNRDLPRVQNDP